MTNYKFNHGFCVIRAQPFHIGHKRIIDEMLQTCANVTVVIGSMQESGTPKNPLPYHIRKKMIQNVYRHTDGYQRLWIMGIKDSDAKPWGEHVMSSIKKERPELTSPDVFYSGEEKDYEWFKSSVPNSVVCARNTQNFPFLTGNIVRDMIIYKYDGWKDFVPEVNHALIEKEFYEE